MKNAIVVWGYSFESDSFDYMLDALSISECLVLNEKNRKIVRSNRVISEFDIYNEYSYYTDRLDECIPLDLDIIQKMKIFEDTALDIINRWRRSIILTDKYTELKDVYYTFIRYWNNYIESNDIEILILHNIPHIPITYIIYSLCRIKCINVVMHHLLPIHKGGLQVKCLINSYENMHKELETEYLSTYMKYKDGESDLCLSDDLRYLLDINRISNIGNTQKTVVVNENYQCGEKLIFVIQRALLYLKRRKFRILLNKMKNYLFIKWRSSNILRYCEKVECNPILDESFFYFPLHFQPEATTLPLSEFFRNQLFIIQMISKYLPLNVVLYVKEHPAFWKIQERYECVSEVRSKVFYDKLRKMGNVRLINHSYDSNVLIENCIAVVTATGSAGFEGLCNKKPVMVFGNVFYSCFKGAFKIESNNECKDAIEKILCGKCEFTLNDLEIFMKSIQHRCISVSLGDGHKSYTDYPHLTVEECSWRAVKGIIKFMNRG